MTTTALIELLKKYEHGGATGRPREVMFEIGDEIIHTDGIEVTCTGDGLFTELFLSLPDAERKKGKWIPVKDSWGEYITTVDAYKCSSCGVNDAYESNYCPNCGADMRGEE